MAIRIHWNPFRAKFSKSSVFHRDFFYVLMGECCGKIYHVGLFDYATLGLPRLLFIGSALFLNRLVEISPPIGTEFVFGAFWIGALALCLPRLTLGAVAAILTGIASILFYPGKALATAPKKTIPSNEKRPVNVDSSAPNKADKPYSNVKNIVSFYEAQTIKPPSQKANPPSKKVHRHAFKQNHIS